MKITNNSSTSDVNNGIHCDVTNCQYHVKDCHCTADKINVGPTYAANTTDTVCSTFKTK